jgi:endonuclease YncB( thermonuclease family)
MSNRRLAAVLSVTVALMGLSVTAMAARARLQYVVDGDTLRLRSGEYVRFIGVDAPESSECGGRASERIMNRLVEGLIRLQRPSGYQNKDGYGRLLRYVYDFGRDAGRASIRRGHAQNYEAFSTHGSRLTKRQSGRQGKPTADCGRGAGNAFA